MNAGISRILFVAICLAATGLALRMTPATPPRAALAAAPQDSPPGAWAALAPPEWKGRFLGAGSCTASACHGNVPHRGPRGAEFSIWLQSDRHALAYHSLLTRRSQDIVRKLGLKPAHTEALCLECHSLTGKAEEIFPGPNGPSGNGPGRNGVLADGVSCEACHGAAEHWLERHKRHRLSAAQRDFDWRSLSGEQKSNWGFHDTKSILGRTTVCLKCHVGSPAADVNHDLIAAGHPRLYFEMSTYEAKVPPHWDGARDRQSHPALDARLWAVGQLATADAALALLEHRSSLKPPSPWPEFAEYGCFNCHHGLTGSDWRQKPDLSGHPGRYQWGTWNFALIERLVRTREGDSTADALQAQLRDFHDLMAQPVPAQDDVIKQSRLLRGMFQELARQADQGPYNADDVQRLMMSLTQAIADDGTRDWDTATQLCLALAAIAHSQHDAAQSDTSSASGYSTANPAIFNELQGIRNLLRFPAANEKLRFSSPRDFGKQQRIDDLTARWERLRQIIEAK